MIGSNVDIFFNIFNRSSFSKNTENMINGEIIIDDISSSRYGEETRGKPCIMWSFQKSLKRSNHFDLIIDKNCLNIIKYLDNFKKFFRKRRFTVHPSRKLLLGLKKSIVKNKDVGSFYVFLGSKIILDDIPSFNEDFSLYSEDNNQELGHFFFTDRESLLRSIDKCIEIDSNSTILDVARIYRDTKKIHPVKIKKYVDFKDTISSIKSNQTLITARSFNSIAIDDTRGLVIKRSPFKQKLKDESNWYKNIPEELRIFVPRVVEEKDEGDVFSLKIEFFGYQNLAERFVYSSAHNKEWEYIIEKCLSTYKIFQSYETGPDKEALQNIYLEKTMVRLNDLASIVNLMPILKKDKIVINGKNYDNFPSIKEKIYSKIDDIINSAKEFSVAHGDYCLSNILIDPINYSLKLIDPRGSTNKQSVYGDPRYDMAKLRGSINGMYDFIIYEMYRLEEIGGKFIFEVFDHNDRLSLLPYLDKMIVKYGFDLEQIKFIEALLFLVMIPLHNEDPVRQKAFYITSMIKFSEVIKIN